MLIPNKARFTIWIIMIITGWILGYYISTWISLPCSNLCIATGIALIAVILRASAVTGRYLAVYGKASSSAGFGEFTKLVREGPYSCMRHPMHLFLSLLPIAVGLVSLNPGMAYITGPILAVLILFMAVKIDEKESIERFGSEYQKYKEEVPAFNLSPACIAKTLLHRPPRRNQLRSTQRNTKQ